MRAVLSARSHLHFPANPRRSNLIEHPHRGSDMAEANERSTSRDADLDDRIRRLETALAERPVPNEDAIADHVIAKLSALAAEREQQSGSHGTLVLASAVDAPAPPEGAVLRPPGPPLDPAPRTWFFSNVIAELRLIFTMYFDP